MKRIITLIIIAASSCSLAFAQVGVNTTDPQQLLHIKGQTGTDDDVTVGTSTGNVGIGTTNPTQKLDVRGNVGVEGNVKINTNAQPAKIGIGTDTPDALLHIKSDSIEGMLRLDDTSPREAGYLMTSDAAGNARWDALRSLSSVKGNRSNCITPNVILPYSAGPPIVNAEGGNNGYVQVTDSNGDITLDPGKWLIFGRVEATVPMTGVDGGFYLYLILCRGTGSSREGINRVGDLGGKPQFIYYTRIATQTTFSLALSSSRGATTTGGGYFYALRIDRY